MRADGGGQVAGRLDREAATFCERKERFSGFFRDEREVDLFSREGPLVGAAQQEQCFGEVDGAGVHGVEAADELGGVVVRVLAGDVEESLGDRQRGAQFVRGVGSESPLFDDMCFEPCEHRVERVCELAELVSAAGQPDPVGERSARRDARRPL